MNRTNSNMDGFVLRRRAQNSDISRQRPSLSSERNVPERFLIDPTKRSEPHTKATPSLHRTVGPAAIAGDSLALPTPDREHLDLDLTLDDEKPTDKPGKKAKKQKKQRKKWSVKKIVLTVVALIVLAALIFGGYFVYKFLATGGKIFKGNVVTALFEQGQPLKEDPNGRSNILLFGTSEDDPGHPGQDLTDSIMVVSVSQKKNEAYVVSIPRDFHVQYGQACVSGYQGKINVVYSCNKDKGEEAAAAALRAKIGEVLGLDIQYSAHVNYTVLREAVDAVGGIDVVIESSDPDGIMDRNFDWQCNYKCYYVKYPNGPVHLDGIHALMLARARGDPTPYGTYGLGRSNPDRQDNQRKILIGLKDKASSAGVLANPVAINNLLETLGNNLRTNFQANEIKTLIELGKNVKTENITSFSLENKDKPLATASCFSGNICPNAGNFNYSAIQAAMTALSTGDVASLEHAKIDVMNASGTPGLAQTEANKLADKNLIIGTVGNAPDALGAQPVSFYDLSGGKKPGTLKKLKELLGVDVTPGEPAGVSSGADFVVIIGKQPAPQQ
ncbi:MAG TPA: LCP family protein [Magnetospirillaceae bacterium]|nr:LCP family protein [Magnetospirillaceae bacterium]